MDINGIIRKVTDQSIRGKGDSDRHALSIFAIALATRGKIYIELGVRGGGTTLPLLGAAFLNKGSLTSVDIKKSNFVCPGNLKKNWEFKKMDSIQFLENYDRKKKIDLVYIDDWHSYEHVKKELEIIDQLVGPSSIILIHDLMWGNTDPFYHCDLLLNEGQWAKGGPYRAVTELNLQFWEWATLPWSNGLTIVRKKYSSKYHSK